MAKNWKEIQSLIANMPRKDVENLLLKAMRKHETFYQYVWVNYFDKADGANDLYEQYLSEINGLMIKGYRGASEELRTANMLDACRKHIDNFCKASDSKERALQLALYVLENPITNYPGFASTCFTKYDYSYFMLFKKAKTHFFSLHPDIQHEYRSRLQTILTKLKRHSSHLDYVYELNDEI
jgi:hypothetical protein